MGFPAQYTYGEVEGYNSALGSGVVKRAMSDGFISVCCSSLPFESFKRLMQHLIVNEEIS